MLTLKLLNERQNGAYRKVDGVSGRLYPFKWDRSLRAYRADFTKQDDVDDLTDFPGRSQLLGVVVPADAPVAGNVAISAAEQEERAVLRSVLDTAAIDTAPGDDATVLKRLMRAYDKGRADSSAHFNAQSGIAAAPEGTPPESPDAGLSGTIGAPNAPDVPASSPDVEAPAAEAEAAPVDPPATQLPAQTKRVRTMAAKKAAREEAERLAAGLETPPES